MVSDSEDVQKLERVCIIGHGASPKGKGLGERIDLNPVVRLKNPSWQKKEDYGERLDYLCSSTETMQIMLDYKKVPKEYWAQPKRGKWNPSTEASFRQRAKVPLRIPLEVHQKWNGIFQNLRQQDTPNISLGTATITYVCEFLKPQEILLVGFDNLLNPDLFDYLKADRGKWVTRHEWKIENSMLPMIEEHYGVKISGFR